ncbi:Predicted O-methyltransferase YrrM [Propionispira arboris]|uniref:tRNA 5-hydroxyuridine methyltransferase n=1 Tax=Propionispira arboris TaxID=84035 RepID=A0A1H6VX99_9FIRM|nr:O-methyltransferase [Propionispira arboris]SEJ06447.1 Predicted O-methyltransferase YrrM [Propionispira arboris]
MEYLLREMEEYAVVHHVPIINVKGKAFLIETVAAKRPHRVLEIGTAIGYSSLLIAENSADDIQITTLELNEERAATARKFINHSRYSEQITILLGDAAVNIDTLQDVYDLVFIDAAKGQYLTYFNKILPHLAADGVVVADNVLFRGYVRSSEKPPRRYKTIVTRLKKYIEIVENHPEFETVIHEQGDGLAVSYRRKNIEKT